MEHLQPQHVEGLCAALSDRQRRVLAHLLDCPPCRAMALPLVLPEGVVPFPRPAHDYRRIWPRLAATFEAAAAVADAEQASVDALLVELFAKPHSDRAALIAQEERFHSFPLAAALLERSYELTPRDPYEGEHLASLALRIADCLDRGGTVEMLVSELRDRAWSLVGDARRRRGELNEAEIAFRRAGRFLSPSSGLLERAGFCALLATLRQDQGRLEECQALRDRAAALLEAAAEAGEES
jgi:tetratricopeptide (TPR) repeat protein